MTLKQDFTQSRLWRASLTMLFATWWGGIVFYALVVVPIGTDMLGSTEQGFITQRVTMWHNGLAAVVCLATLLEALQRKRWACWLLAASLWFVTLGLFAVHEQLTAMLDIEGRSVPTEFYRRHAIYLWLTTVEWLIGLCWMWLWLSPGGPVAQQPGG